MTRKLVFIGLIIFAAGAPLLSSAATVTNTNVNPYKDVSFALPRAGLVGNGTTTDPAALVAYIYDVALLIGGLLAFDSILYGGIMYLTTGGNTSGQHEAKERIRDAVIGLLLLLGIYLVLHMINPDLTKLRFPVLQRLEQPKVSVSTSGTMYTCKFSDGSYDGCYGNSSCDGDCPATPTGNAETDDENGICTTSAICSNPTPPAHTNSATCQQSQTVYPNHTCAVSDQLATVINCVQRKAQAVSYPHDLGINITTTDKSHSLKSCHFGGPGCQGGHAVDYGLNTAGGGSQGNLDTIRSWVKQCGSSLGIDTACYDERGSERPPVSGPRDHIHCNVGTQNPTDAINGGACGCS